MMRFDVFTEQQAKSAHEKRFIRSFFITQTYGGYEIEFETEHGNCYALAQVRGMEVRRFKTIDAAIACAKRIGFDCYRFGGY